MNIFDHSHNETHRMIDGEILLRAGQPARHIYLVERGQIKILTAEGRILHRYHHGDLFGIPEVLSGLPWPAMPARPACLACSGLACPTGLPSHPCLPA